MTTVFFLLALAAAVFWMISAYNRLIALKGQVANGWKQIDVQLKRRHDLIPNLVDTVKGALKFERETLEAVIKARNSAISAEGVGNVAHAENMLTQALGKMFALQEAYPELKAVANIGELQEELASTENRIAFSRQHYNDVATNFNVAQDQFPTNLVAGLAKAVPAELWEIVDDAERTVPKVDLGLG
jgi:LemA protein